MTTTLAAIAVAAPLIAAAIGLLLSRFIPTSAVVVTGTGIAAVLTIIVAFDASSTHESSALLTPTGSIPITIGMRVDGLSATVAVMVALVALAIQVYSIGYMRHEQRYPSFASLVSLFTAAMLIVVLSADLIVTYVGWEIMGICSYFLIGHHWEKPSASAAAVKSFLMTRFGDVGFLFGIFVLGVAAGSFRISTVIAAVPSMSAGTLLAATLLLTAGVVGKSAQFPLHSWLPDAMAGPAPVSALIHAATMVAAGAYVVALLFPVFVAAPFTLSLLAVLAVISMVGAALAALTTDDLKRVLAYSTISQLSLMFAGLAVGGRVPAIGHLLSHAAFKALLFLCSGAVIIAVGSNLMADMGGLRRAMPITFGTMTVGFAALAGLPPTAGFFSKDAIIAAAERAASGDPAPVGAGVGWIVLIGLLLTVLLTAGYATRAWLRTFFGPRKVDVYAEGELDTEAQAVAVPERGEAPPVMTVPLILLAIPALLLGFGGLWWEELRPEWGSSVLSVVLAGIGATVAYVVWRADPVRDPADRLGTLRPVFSSAFRSDDLYERTVARGITGLAGGVLSTDDHVVAAAVTGTGRGAGRLGGVLRLTQNGNPQFYLTGLLAGVLLISLGVVILR